jgi:DNA-binding YbaB/EbfC family protein
VPPDEGDGMEIYIRKMNAISAALSMILFVAHMIWGGLELAGMTAGGNAVKVTVTGKMEVKSIEIEPEVIDPDDAEMLSDLIIAATNEALRAAATEKEDTMSSLSGGLNIPGLF